MTTRETVEAITAELLGDLEALPRSAIVCTARVVGALDCRKGFAARRIVGGDLWDRQARTKIETLFSSRWWVGPVGWLLDDVRVCTTPVPCKGAMGLWTVPAPIAFDVGQQTAEAA